MLAPLKHERRVPKHERGKDRGGSDNGCALAAKQNGVRIGQIRSKAKDTDPIGLRPVEIDADFSGDYLQLVRFINALERDPLFFIINSVELGGEQAGVVRLQLKLETYQKANG